MRQFHYLDQIVPWGCEKEIEVNQRLNEEARMMEDLGCLWKSSSLSIVAKGGMFEEIVAQLFTLSVDRFPPKCKPNYLYSSSSLIFSSRRPSRTRAL